jgi:hypothetical protein
MLLIDRSIEQVKTTGPTKVHPSWWRTEMYIRHAKLYSFLTVMTSVHAVIHRR